MVAPMMLQSARAGSEIRRLDEGALIAFRPAFRGALIQPGDGPLHNGQEEKCELRRSPQLCSLLLAR